MSENIRIKTTPGGANKNINVKINQKFDFIEILSLKISQDEAYRRFCSDYGVIVGRVIINNGVGVPNAKVSIFIPVDEIDIEDPEISGLYPYEVISDRDDESIPYNLLPRNNRGKDDCFTPIGTFPSKREVQDNPEMGQIFCQYYKFTTTTNESGDFMLFGVPVGTHQMHVDADLSDIGVLSQRPYDLIRDGESEKGFQGTSKFKNRKQSTDIKQLESVTPILVTVPPFWGDTDQCQIGIARADAYLTKTITPTAIFMGSLISDNDKHALSRNCVPRKKLGKMQYMVTGDGTVEMIRKTNDGNTERFDVEGGQVIDEDGTWAYQIPMNTNYMVTAEDGTFVPSEDTTRGIPTKSTVRFRIGMNVNGDEGKLRTRAKYLVPHNPTTWVGSSSVKGVDFSFDTSTDIKHFTELSWNKIYTVKNHITRVQARGGGENRNFIGFKNVDDAFSNNPIPFNKMDNDINPLFTILCIIIKIIARIVGLINRILIPLINLVIRIINFILQKICIVIAGIGKIVCIYLIVGNNQQGCREGMCMGDCIGNCKGGKKQAKPATGGSDGCYCGDILDYLSYITLKCGLSANKEYAPGGKYGEPGKTPRNAYHLTWLATRNREDADGNVEVVDFHYIEGHLHGAPDVDRAEHECTNKQRFLTIEGCDAGWSKCQTFQLADALDVYKFDFYNDWINGTLYPFLLKHKIKKHGTGKEKFCEVDCDEFAGGVDNDGNGTSDNRCKHNYIVDTCVSAKPQLKSSSTLGITDTGVNADTRIQTRSGYIKKFDGELYYSPLTRVGDNKLFATDIVNLGSVFDCDWEGQPKLYKYLTDSSFNMPPVLPEYIVIPVDSNGTMEVSGYDSGTSPGLIGNLSCFGFATGSESCNNLKRLCELGMGLDELRDNGVVSVTDNEIRNDDIEQDYIRGIFKHLNTPTSSGIDSVRLDATTYSDYGNIPYTTFRANGGIISSNSGKDIWIYDNSFYFYFGLNKGNTALSKMKRKFFAECTPESDIDFFVIAKTIGEDTVGNVLPDGSIDLEVVGGVGPYKYSWTGPSVNIGTSAVPNIVSFPPTTTEDISNLYAGTYTVTVIDDAGNEASGTFIVPGPPSVKCLVSSNTAASENGNSDGEFTLAVSDGLGPYTLTFNAYDITGTTSTGSIGLPLGTVGGWNTTNFSSPTTINGLASGFYIAKVTDSSIPETSCESVIYIDEPPELTVTLVTSDVTCYGDTNGTMFANVSGGQGLYTFLWSNLATTSSINTLPANTTYSVTVRDNNGDPGYQEKIVSASLSQPGQLNGGTITKRDECGGLSAAIFLTGVNGGTANSLGEYTVRLSGGDNFSSIPVTTTDQDTSGGAVSFVNLPNGADYNDYTVTITDSAGCIRSHSIKVYKPAVALSVSLSAAVDSSDATKQILTASITGGVFEQDTNAPMIHNYQVRLQSSPDGSVGSWSSESWATRAVNYQTISKTSPAAIYYRYQVKDDTGCTVESNVKSY